MAGYFINQALQYITINADKARFEVIIEKLRAAAIAAGQNTMTYQEVINVINDMKSLAEKLQLTCNISWFMIANITSKMRSSNLQRYIYPFQSLVEDVDGCLAVVVCSS